MPVARSATTPCQNRGSCFYCAVMNECDLQKEKMTSSAVLYSVYPMLIVHPLLVWPVAWIRFLHRSGRDDHLNVCHSAWAVVGGQRKYPPAILPSLFPPSPAFISRWSHPSVILKQLFYLEYWNLTLFSEKKTQGDIFEWCKFLPGSDVIVLFILSKKLSE